MNNMKSQDIGYIAGQWRCRSWSTFGDITMIDDTPLPNDDKIE